MEKWNKKMLYKYIQALEKGVLHIWTCSTGKGVLHIDMILDMQCKRHKNKGHFKLDFAILFHCKRKYVFECEMYFSVVTSQTSQTWVDMS